LQDDPVLSKQLVRIPQSAVAFLSPEINKPPFDQLGVRQALQHALDRETILKLIYGLGQPAYTLISQDQPYAIDPKKSRWRCAQLAQQSSWLVRSFSSNWRRALA
jgi:ABC-type transport system substrate-binding protein